MSGRSASSELTADSTLAIISVAGMFVGVTVKFSPFFNRDSSASLRDLDRQGQINNPLSFVNIKCSCMRNRSSFTAQKFFKLALLTVFGGIKDSLGVRSDLVQYLRCILS